MSNSIFTMIKCLFPFFPFFAVVISLISLIYPQYMRYQQDLDLKNCTVVLTQKIEKKIRQQKLEELIISGTKGFKDKILQEIMGHSLQKQRLHRLQASIGHLACVDQRQIIEAIKEIQQANRIELCTEQKSADAYMAKLENSVYLEEEDLCFLLNLLNQPNITVQKLIFDKVEKIDGEVFLLNQLEMMIYEEKN